MCVDKQTDISHNKLRNAAVDQDTSLPDVEYCSLFAQLDTVDILAIEEKKLNNQHVSKWDSFLAYMLHYETTKERMKRISKEQLTANQMLWKKMPERENAPFEYSMKERVYFIFVCLTPDLIWARQCKADIRFSKETPIVYSIARDLSFLIWRDSADW